MRVWEFAQEQTVAGGWSAWHMPASEFHIQKRHIQPIGSTEEIRI